MGTTGRLAFTVDLGPSHTYDQYTPQQRVLEAAGDYWTVRHVTIEPAGA